MVEKRHNNDSVSVIYKAMLVYFKWKYVNWCKIYNSNYSMICESVKRLPIQWFVLLLLEKC